MKHHVITIEELNCKLNNINHIIDSCFDEISNYLDMNYCNTSQGKTLHIIQIIKDKLEVKWNINH
jgi:hypothetical protein